MMTSPREPVGVPADLNTSASPQRDTRWEAAVSMRLLRAKYISLIDCEDSAIGLSPSSFEAPALDRDGTVSCSFLLGDHGAGADGGEKLLPKDGPGWMRVASQARIYRSTICLLL